jgi:hypothetical protein
MKEKRVRLNVALPERLHRKLKAKAATEGVTIVRLLEAILSRWFNVQ